MARSNISTTRNRGRSSSSSSKTFAVAWVARAQSTTLPLAVSPPPHTHTRTLRRPPTGLPSRRVSASPHHRAHTHTDARVYRHAWILPRHFSYHLGLLLVSEFLVFWEGWGMTHLMCPDSTRCASGMHLDIQTGVLRRPRAAARRSSRSRAVLATPRHNCPIRRTRTPQGLCCGRGGQATGPIGRSRSAKTQTPSFTSQRAACVFPHFLWLASRLCSGLGVPAPHASGRRGARGRIAKLLV